MVRRAGGYTLTEVMMVVDIIGILLSTAPVMMIQLQNNFLLAKTRIQLQEEARPIMEIIISSLRQASGQPPYSRITFYDIQGSTVSFYQTGTYLYEKRGSNLSKLTRDVQYLSFGFPRSDDMQLVSVALTLQDATYQGQVKALHMSSQQIQVMNQ